jgi:predicted O-linked N-acetylglucosamine transferase (SPINDLY family)
MEDVVGSRTARLPADVDALRQAALALRAEGRLAEAAAALGQATALAPDHADAFADLGYVYNLLGRPAEAEASYRRALASNPGHVRALANLATTLQSANRHREAEALHRQALEIDPDYAPALLNLGVLLKNDARVAEAKALFKRGARLAPGIEPMIQAHLALSPVTRTLEDIAEQRASYSRGLEELAAEPQTFAHKGEEPNLPWYYLAYHGCDDRPLLERTAEVLGRRIEGLDFAAPHLAGWTAEPGRRIRIGFCSEYLRGHTVGHLFGGFLRHLDRTRFEVVLIHAARSVRNDIRDEFDGFADRVLLLDAGLAAAQRQIAQLALDVLIYPDIGMSAQTWFLAHARLAPVQAVSWGHPETSGIKSLDYFISCDAIEPQGAEACYTERLVRMRRLPCCYEPPAAPPVLTREDLRLPPTGALYGCPQTAFKFHPDFDAVLAGVAERDPDGHIVLIEGHVSSYTELLRERWAASHPVLLERVRFLPRLTHEGFMAHLAHIDVLLDPLHFGSGRTLYEGIATGAPIVTCPGEFARSRIVAAAYAQMGVVDAPVAASSADYVRLAVALGRDRARRAALSRQLLAAAPALFDDRTAVRELESFLEAAVAAAARQERLPTGWRSPAEVFA